jgi:outer membrane protein OmpA-like peptidoglycan-associated protein/outer membrane murein-binding lipoprotein Lpp
VNIAKNLVAAAVGSILIAGCASTPKTLPELEQAHADVETLARDPLVEQAASKELSDARSSLQGADTALKEGRKEDALHYAYLASQQAQTGEARIKEQRSKQEVAKGEAERNKVLLEARTAEAEKAAAAAKEQAAQAEAARQQALSAQAQAEDLQKQLADLQAKQTDRGMVLTLGDVLFDTGKATLKPGADRVMERVAAFMEKNPDTKVIVEGHTDSRGSDEYNQELSKHRADAVADALASRGIDRGRVQAIGKGEGLPVASNDTTAGRQQNRRVEIVFSDKEGHFASGANSAYR